MGILMKLTEWAWMSSLETIHTTERRQLWLELWGTSTFSGQEVDKDLIHRRGEQREPERMTSSKGSRESSSFTCSVFYVLRSSYVYVQWT